MSSIFYFKQFAVKQNLSAMKVGTDGVLLGAWVNAGSPGRILDIGTGTGLIALMMAQKFPDALIEAIEPEKAAFEEAKFNFVQSLWTERLKVNNVSLQEFSSQEKYDLIVSNPPFYNSTFKQLNESRAMARHTQGLSYSELLNNSHRLLNSNGLCFFVFPFSEELSFVKTAAEAGLYPGRICRVRGNENTDFKRVLLCLGTEKNTLKEEELIIEKSRGVYTDEYVALTREFYLKM
jgi:tRNA1Val (adenine37-N6)-methyltransferase